MGDTDTAVEGLSIKIDSDLTDDYTKETVS